jgi:hypothetical protein
MGVLEFNGYLQSGAAENLYSIYHGIRMNQKYDYSHLMSKMEKIKVSYSPYPEV